MHVMILGAGGMIGSKLAARIATEGALAGQPVKQLTLADLDAPKPPDTGATPCAGVALNIAAPEAAAQIVAQRPDVIYHLAAIVSGEAERDFEKGYQINLSASQAIFDAIRVEPHYHPRLIFTSSLAVYGAPLPDRIAEDQIRAPLTSYGTQKAITELLLDDYTRRGAFDGIGIRLPTIVIRPGAPNAAASGFFSGILREPLAGQRAVLPVSDSVTHWFASPRSAVGFLIHAAGLDDIGPRRTLNMPGVEASVAVMIAALIRAKGEAAARLIDRVPNPEIARIIEAWPRGFDPARAVALGFTAEHSVDELIAVYLEDDAPQARDV